MVAFGKRNLAFIAIAAGALAVSALFAETAGPAAKIDYNRAVRPILANNCFKCHGFDARERKAELRLDLHDEAVKPRKSGRPAIASGKPDESLLVERITSIDEDRVMPPPATGKKLAEAEKDLLKRWIAEGAEYQAHWAFIPPKRPALPAVHRADWPRHPIDFFILARLEKEGLLPRPEAERTALIRRVTLDLTGLPPALAEVDAFLADQSSGAYEKVVDRLLASPHYGERMALDWLDASRFADTHGFHIDSGRDMSRWREWVIEAFNRNLPFDRFTIEQLAGDLIPNATLEQKIASGFNRNHMINFEGGAIPEEYLNAYIVDRVNTTATVWLGLTLNCTQCHDHKFDPFTQKEFYQLYAFFHNVPENGLDGSKGNAMPFVKTPAPEEEREMARLEAGIRRAEEQLAAPAADLDRARAEIDQLKKALAEIDRKVRTTMVMAELPQPRETFMLLRGQYDKKGEKVSPGVPAALPPLPEGAPLNRLGLARWLVSPNQPLTARVIANRTWQMVFGTGIIKTAEDFGSQGEPPVHPDLLDWLAAEFMESGWNVKALVRLIVTSSAYRQASSATPELRERDPENRLIARGPRFRLQAEFIRDQALAASGLLDRRLGGSSVSPYQPSGLWEELMSREDGANWTAQVYVQSHGPDLYRRTLYTFWKRTSPPPTLSTFDAPDRETCTVRRSRTNTPLQALILMNDPTYVEASRRLAERLLREGGTAAEDRIAFAFRLATARRPAAEELAVLKKIFDEQLAHYRKHPDAASRLLKVGESESDGRLDAAELGAWTVVASVILNLDETVTKG